MGIVVDYRGRLDDPSQMDAALDTVRQFCRQVGWECSDYVEPISGVVVNPSERDGVRRGRLNLKSKTLVKAGGNGIEYCWDARHVQLVEGAVRGVIAKAPNDGHFPVTFDSDGWLGYFMQLPEQFLAGTPYASVKHYFWWPSGTKTSFGGFEFHVAVCAILKRLERDFIRNLKVDDQTDYFKTGDLKSLRAEHEIMSIFLGSAQEPGFLKAIMSAAGVPEEDLENAVLLDPRTMEPKDPQKKVSALKPPAQKAKVAKPTVH